MAASEQEGAMKKIVIAGAFVAGLVLVAVGYRAYLIHEMRKPILAMMVDPDAAQFRDERYFGDWTGHGGILCGQVNAKNRAGGYIGYRWFSSTSEEGRIESDDMKQRFDAAGKQRCEYGSAMDDIASWWWLRY